MLNMSLLLSVEGRLGHGRKKEIEMMSVCGAQIVLRQQIVVKFIYGASLVQITIKKRWIEMQF